MLKNGVHFTLRAMYQCLYTIYLNISIVVSLYSFANTIYIYKYLIHTHKHTHSVARQVAYMVVRQVPRIVFRVVHIYIYIYMRCAGGLGAAAAMRGFFGGGCVLHGYA